MIEQSNPPVAGRQGVGIRFAQNVRKDGEPGTWYRTPFGVSRSALTERTKRWAKENGVELEVHRVDDGSYRLFGRIVS